MSNPNLQDIHDFLVSLAYKAGEIINNALPDTSGPGSKKNTADLVTEYDRAVENMISTSLKERYPDYQFHGEETYSPDSPLTDAPTFIVDPIDGTVNFVHSFPYACVSLGFAINRIPAVGVVFNPSTNTLWSAIRGQGAFRNKQAPLPLKGKGNVESVEPLSGLSNALVAIEWGSDRSGPNWETKVRTFEKLGKAKEEGGAMVRSFRSLGSAALNLCAVAEGTMDVYWEGGCWEWDVCAAWVILAEAGGMMVDGNPGDKTEGGQGWETTLDGRKYLAIRGASRESQREIVKEFWSFIQGRLEY